MRIARIAAVATRVVSASALAGAVVGVLAWTVWLLPTADALDMWRDLGFVGFVAVLGGVMGVLLGPLAAWLLMPHVPLWKVMCGTALGALAGSLLPLVAHHDAGAMLGGPFLGFIAATFVLLLEKARKDLPGRRS